MDKVPQTQVGALPLSAAVPHASMLAEPDAQCAWGLWCASGLAEPDYVAAAEWYRKAADQGHALAQFNLGVMHATGQGCDRDEAQAAAWFEKAAQGGDVGAQFRFGRMCHRKSLDETLVPAGESRIEAYKWLHLASAQGYQGADAALTMVNLSMSLAEVNEGNRRVADYAVAAAAKTD